jgi:hypothetical protein
MSLFRRPQNTSSREADLHIPSPLLYSVPASFNLHLGEHTDIFSYLRIGLLPCFSVSLDLSMQVLHAVAMPVFHRPCWCPSYIC